MLLLESLDLETARKDYLGRVTPKTSAEFRQVRGCGREAMSSNLHEEVDQWHYASREKAYKLAHNHRRVRIELRVSHSVVKEQELLDKSLKFRPVLSSEIVIPRD